MSSQFQNTNGQNMFYNTMGPSGIAAHILAGGEQPTPTDHELRPASKFAPSGIFAHHNFPVTGRNKKSRNIMINSKSESVMFNTEAINIMNTDRTNLIGNALQT